jgi:hypothetical protein
MNNNGVINNGANGVQWRNGNVNISNENGWIISNEIIIVNESNGNSIMYQLMAMSALINHQ